MVMLVGVVSVIFAIKIKSILDILIYSYNFWSPIVLVPLVAAIMGIKATRKSFFIGSLAGILGVVIWNFILHNPRGIDGLIIGIAGNGIAFSVGDCNYGIIKRGLNMGNAVFNAFNSLFLSHIFLTPFSALEQPPL